MGLKEVVGIKKAKKLKNQAEVSIGMDTGKNMAKKELQDLLESYDVKESQLSDLESKIEDLGRPKLRALLFRVTLPLVRHNDEFRHIHEYYTTRTKNPLEKKQSLIALCCKLIKILYTLGTREIEYNGEKMLNDIERPVEYNSIINLNIRLKWNLHLEKSVARSSRYYYHH